MRDRLRDQLLFLGLIDVQDTIVGPQGAQYRKPQGPAGAGDSSGLPIPTSSWERAHGVFYTPACRDMAVRAAVLLAAAIMSASS